MSSTKRCRRPSSSSPEPFESAPKRHRPNRTTPILRLSDELFLRICFHLPIRDLASFQLVSHRCSRVAVDGQIWKALYYQRFVLPRASRIRGLIRGQLGGYSSRRSRWLEEEGIAREVGTNWKALYKLRHNWARGSCAVRGIKMAGEDREVDERGEEGLLGIVFTASSAHGLQAWQLHNIDKLIAQTQLYSNSVPFSCTGAPTALTADEESGGKSGVVNVTIGFGNGGFTMYQLDMAEEISIFRIRYVYALRGRTRDSTKITAMAALGPYLATMTGGGIGFLGADGGGASEDSMGTDGDSSSRLRSSPECPTFRMTPTWRLHAPNVLASLRSSTAWPPIALSLRRSVNKTLLASIVYSCPLFSGWSVSCQELRFRTGDFETTPTGRRKHQTVLEESRIATAIPSGFTPLSLFGNSSPNVCGGLAGFTGHSHNGSQSHGPPLAQPTSVSYQHPYLITSHADNTLTLYLVRSASTLTIDPGQRLWGHTAGVSSVMVDGRGKAVSINRFGSEIRVWELEGGVSERRRVNASVRIEPVVRRDDVVDSLDDNYPSFGNTTTTTSKGHLGGFDDEKVVLLKETAPATATPASCCAAAGQATTQALVVYDFTR
ncbi:hypothetical protein BDD12DRAFT_733869 [Trichophaea hybrida]|nr:hypothetical protein BDD12DRAFT_733869 [Trichophaea hybrida]